MESIWDERIRECLDERKITQGYRTRVVTQQYEHYLNFASNDYLGLSRNAKLIRAWQQGAQLYGVGSGGSAHVSGYHLPLSDLERELAQWLGYDRAIVYSTGFAANQAVIQLLIEKDDRIIADKLSHASLVEAAMMSKGGFKRFAHNDCDSLSRLLERPQLKEAATLVVTEGIFSMDGDEAPLQVIHQLTQANSNHWLMVDDAHGIGVNGEEGKGTCNKHGIHPEILIVTFGKAFGCSGAAILCSDELAEYLVQKSRALIYSTAMPPAQAYTLLTAIEVVRNADAQRKYLAELIDYFKTNLAKLGLHSESTSAIQPILVGSNQKSLEVSRILQEHNLWAVSIRPPTVPPNSSRIRLTLNCTHTHADIDHLMKVLDYAIN